MNIDMNKRITIDDLARMTSEGFHEVFDRMNKGFTEVRQEMTELRVEFKQDLAELRRELKYEIAGTRDELKDDIKEVRADIKKLDNRMARVEVGVFDHERRITAIENNLE